MAIYHANTKAISRGKGHSSTANAAYIGGKEITDLRTGEVFDYSRKGGVLENKIILPNGIDLPTLTSQELWNKAEESEKRKDARVGREWEISLPHELTPEQRAVLAKELIQNLADRYGVACEYAIHHPSRENSDDRNHHVHILTTTRKIDISGNLGEKSDIELDRKQCAQKKISISQEQISEIREQIANTINKHLELSLCQDKVTHLSLQAQGIDREPTTHKGKALCEQERRLDLQMVKIESQIVYDDHELAKANAELAQEQKNQAIQQDYFKSVDNQQIDLDKLFSFARKTGDFFTKDSEKHCYTNKNKSIDVYKDSVAINVATEANITKGLKLAQSQFGNLLEIKGSDEFKSQSIKVLAHSQELKDIKLSNPEHQVELDKLRADFVISSKLRQPQEQELSIRERIRQRLTESNSKPSLEAVRQQEDPNIGRQGLSARDIARERVNNIKFRSTREVVNDYNQQKEKELEQKQQPLQEKIQTKVKEQIKEIDHSRSRGGWER